MTQSANKHDVTTGSISAHLVRLTIPMLWGIGTIISAQLVDTYFVAKLGTDALAAISFTFPVTYAIFSISIAFGIAMASNIARLIGEKKTDDVCRLTTQGIALSTLSMMAICGIALLFHEALFIKMGTLPHLLPLISAYMGVWLIALPFVTIPMVGNSSIRAGGDAMTPAYIMTIIAVANLIFDPILIFGLLGAPALGIAGAAYATLIAHIMGACAGLYILKYKKNRIQLKWLKETSTIKDTAKRLYFLALPIGITGLILPVTNAFIIALLSKISIESVTAFGIANRVEAFAFIVLMALSTSMSPIIGQNWGAKKYDRVRETLRLSIKFNILFSLGIAIVLGITGQHIAQLFTSDPTTVKMTQLFFWVVPISYALSNLANGWMSAFNALGKPKYSLIMMVGKYIIFLIPALWVGQQYGAIGIFTALSIVNIISGIAAHHMGWKICKQPS